LSVSNVKRTNKKRQTSPGAILQGGYNQHFGGYNQVLTSFDQWCYLPFFKFPMIFLTVSGFPWPLLSAT
jgi:hypothetical protein